MGIDCAGLALIAFNSDPDKKMPDIDIWDTKTNMMLKKFEDSSAGDVFDDISGAQEGDFLFRLENKVAKHVMVVVNNDNDKIEIIDAWKTGTQVNPRKFDKQKGISYKLARSHRYDKYQALTTAPASNTSYNNNNVTITGNSYIISGEY